MAGYSRYLTFVAAAIIGVSCSVKKPVQVQNSSATTASLARDYIDAYSEIAVSEMKRTGIPASITLAQGMIESDFGRSTLARDANNHFGIKCHNGWSGPTVTHHDDRRNECFRKYRRVEDSFYDHSDFLVNGSRYRDLFSYGSSDYKSWAKGLKKAGYATNPHYADILIRNIEENNLWMFDRGLAQGSRTAAKDRPDSDRVQQVAVQTVQNGIKEKSVASVYAVTPRIMENNRVQYIIVRDGETRERIEKEFGLLKWELPKYNELDTDFVPVAGQVLYLQPKRDKAEPGKDYHTVAEGETLYSVSQKYAVKLKSLRERNMIETGTEAPAGTKLILR